jgi:tRNA threonylcarbamoyladenosine biosynthesis protein TsaE
MFFSSVGGRGPRERCETSNASQTEALGAELAGDLRAGDVAVVEGELGAGKTTLVRGAARALGVEATVNSPTFTIGQRYPAPIPVSHLDLFRIVSLDDEDPELLADYIGPGTISFIEVPPQGEPGWSQLERAVGAHGRIAARVTIEHAGGEQRAIRIRR